MEKAAQNNKGNDNNAAYDSSIGGGLVPSPTTGIDKPAVDNRSIDDALFDFVQFNEKEKQKIVKEGYEYITLVTAEDCLREQLDIRRGPWAKMKMLKEINEDECLEFIKNNKTKEAIGIELIFNFAKFNEEEKEKIKQEGYEYSTLLKENNDVRELLGIRKGPWAKMKMLLENEMPEVVSEVQHEIEEQKKKKNKKLALAASATPYISIGARGTAGVLQIVRAGGRLVAGFSIASFVTAACIFAGQAAYHTYKFCKGTTTLQQFRTDLVCDASVAGFGVGLPFAGAAIGTLVLPGVGTTVGGLIGSLLATIGALLLPLLGKKIKDNSDAKNRKKLLKTQYTNALRLFNMRDADVDKYNLEKMKKQLFRMRHPDKNKSPNAHNEFLDVCFAYNTIRQEKGYDEQVENGCILIGDGL